MFRIEVLPAADGDSIWIEYGNPTRPRRIVVDGGPAPTYEPAFRQRLLQLLRDDRRIDLFVVTHIDADHIDGSIIFLREAQKLRVRLGEVWQVRTVLRSASRPVKGHPGPAPLALDVADAVAEARLRLIRETLRQGPCSLQALAAITGLDLRIVSDSLGRLLKKEIPEVRRLPRGRLERYELIQA